MYEPLKQVAEFHQAFNHPILTDPQIPSIDRCKLRVNLLQEELEELKKAIEDGDVVEAADAFADLQYVLAGAIIEFGMQDKFPAIFNEVHRSNMSKACKTEEEALATMKHYMDNEGVDSYFEHLDDLWFVRRTSDNKTLKSINYSPASIKGLLK